MVESAGTPPPADEARATRTGPFQVGQIDGIPVIEVAGDVDVSNAHTLEAALEHAARKEGGPVIVSLGGSTYFDSRGIHMLLRFNRRLRMSGRRLLVVVPWHHPLKAVLNLFVGAVDIPVVQTIAEALAAAQSPA